MTLKYEIINMLTILLFGLPIVYFILKRKVFIQFSLKELLKSFNLAFIVQLILAGIFFISIEFLDKTIYVKGAGTDLTDIFMETSKTYLIIGIFCYLPALILLNLIGYLISIIK